MFQRVMLKAQPQGTMNTKGANVSRETLAPFVLKMFLKNFTLSLLFRFH